MTKENKEQEYYRFEFEGYDGCFEIDDSWVDFYDVPGDMTIKELHDIVGDSCLHKIKLGFSNVKEIMESKEYIKPKRIPTKRDERGVRDWTVVLPNGDKITEEYDDNNCKIIDNNRRELIPFFITTKRNGEILKPIMKKIKKRNTSSKIDECKNIKNILDYPPEIINQHLCGVQSLEAPIGQIYTLKFPKIKKDNIFKRIWNKIK